jgi:octaprenyl-diphosphate synthase
MERYFSKKKIRNEKDLVIAKNLIKKHKSIEKTIDLANKYGDNAKKDLSVFNESPIKKGLVNLVDFSLVRDH